MDKKTNPSISGISVNLELIEPAKGDQASDSSIPVIHLDLGSVGTETPPKQPVDSIAQPSQVSLEIEIPSAKEELKVELNVAPQVELKVEPQPELKVEPQPELKVEPQSELKIEPQIEIQSEIDIKSKVKADPQDNDTLKKYLQMREHDISVITSQFEYARQELDRAHQQIELLTSKNDELQHQIDYLKSKNEELEKEKFNFGSSLDGEREQLRSEIKTKIDRIRVLEDKLKSSDEQYELLKERVRSDIRKIRVRERELENKLEILKKDSETLINAREQRILDLKRKIDLIEFNYDTLQEKVQFHEKQAVAERERMDKALKALKLSIGILEVNDETKKEAS